MIVLDTNVISELRKPHPSKAVLAWLDSQPRETLYLSAVTLAEIGFGIACLPVGRRRNEHEVALDRTREDFADRILGFDEGAATHYARLAVTARQNGKGFPTPDGYIAAIAAATATTIAIATATDIAIAVAIAVAVAE